MVLDNEILFMANTLLEKEKDVKILMDKKDIEKVMYAVREYRILVGDFIKSCGFDDKVIKYYTKLNKAIRKEDYLKASVYKQKINGYGEVV